MLALTKYGRQIQYLGLVSSFSGRLSKWTGLYILYRMREYPVPLQSPQRKAHLKCTANQLIKEFQRQCRSTTAKTLLKECAHYFKPYKLQKDGLMAVGIKGNHAAIRINFQVTKDEQNRIAAALVHLSRTITKQHCKEFVH